ncbi:exodeoxyribonuclease-3 [Microbacterium keratanolyticum]|uniref:Exodeoxyribonuclease n=1 Tax=Microbacterium keratanolyticum TaxID=67574 RepID=A0A9W6HUR2_9MICO|nr:exodeoxyribonuclease III [Microbacterium keratanolyticum]MBM7468012.1 exodeoxyribonuclease-3 [Microbacterium keratanolyticum]GLK03003.1 putative exodeoxyribonuclease [Microbacterium keratanolyticum]
MPHLRVATVNVNGIRASVRNGMHTWLDAADVDVLTLQEVRGQDEHLAEAFPGWSIVHDPATAKGRAGVAIVSRVPALATRTAFGDDDFDSAGRWLEGDFLLGDVPLTVVSAYVHSGEAETPKQDEKWKFLEAMGPRLSALAMDDALAVVTGDLNVGHRELDIKNWRGNRKKAGFLPRERGYFDRFLGAHGQEISAVDGTAGTGLGWVDVGRHVHGEVEGPYTWWSNRGQAFDNDTGWRIDYHLASPALAPRIGAYHVARAATYAERWSDHAPVVVDYTY